MDRIQAYNKFIVAALGAAVTIAAIFHVALPAFLTDQETVAKLVAAITPFLVYLIPNKPSVVK